MPVTPSRWPDFERLFGDRGACAGCWCMYWRLEHADFERGKGEGNKRSMRDLISAPPGRRAPGVLAYAGKEPIGWCSIAPRPALPRLARSRILAPVDDSDVWSVVCFFVARAHRGSGVSVDLLEGAVDYAGRRGARTVEGYPNIPRKSRIPDAFAWCGIVATFERAGFAEVLRRSDSRPIMRREL